MPRANTDFNSLPWWDWRKISNGILWGFDVNNWSALAHKMTKWEYWPQPDGEKITLFKIKTKVSEVPAASTVPWQEAAHRNRDGERVTIPALSAGIIGYFTGLWEGTYGGEPVQMGARDKSNVPMYRAATYGYAEYGDHFMVPDPGLPLPASGRYEHCGGPNIASDRHVNIVDPASGNVHELIQFDDTAPDTPISNQALAWGLWSPDGKLLRGTASTATGTSITSMLWDRTSRERGGHRLGLVTADYVGADGTLTEGPIAGEIYYLPRDSASYKAMKALGGECAAIADALADYGCLLCDRNGYGDSDNRTPGKLPKAPAVGIQWGAWARNTNLDKLRIPLSELRMIVRK